MGHGGGGGGGEQKGGGGERSHENLRRKIVSGESGEQEKVGLGLSTVDQGREQWSSPLLNGVQVGLLYKDEMVASSPGTDG